jgi:hypothetical protein
MSSKSPRKRSVREPAATASDVDAFIARLKHPLEPEIRAIRSIILGADPRIAEGIKWNAPSFHTSEHFATLHLRGKTGVQVVMHFGVKPRSGTTARETIADPTALLDWRGPDRATVTFNDLKDVKRKERAFAEIVRRWITFL